MSDKPGGRVPITPPGQAGPASGIPQEPVNGDAGQEPITWDAIRAAAREEALRASQSLTDKAESRINKKIQVGLAELDRVLNMQRGHGVEITPAQEQAYRSQVIAEAYQDPGEPSQPAPVPPGPGGGEQPSDSATPSDPVTAFVNAEAQRILEAAGVDIEDGDPELEMIPKDGGDAYAFLKAVEAAAQAKVTRLGGPQPGPRTPAGFGGGGTPPAEELVSLSPSELWARVQTKEGL